MLVMLLMMLALMTSQLTWSANVTLSQCPVGLPSTTVTRVHTDLCYQFVSEERYWTGARDYCIQYGGRLVMINDADTNEFIVSTLNRLWWRNNGVWIGLHDNNVEMTWQWIGKTKFENDHADWFNWGRGHPRAFLHTFRDCIRMVRGDGLWQWHETPCTTLTWKYRFICQYEPVAEESMLIPDQQHGLTDTTTTTTTMASHVLSHLLSAHVPDKADHRVSLLHALSTSSTNSANSQQIVQHLAAMSSHTDNSSIDSTHNSGWIVSTACMVAVLSVLLVAVLLWRRRTNRQLMLVAVSDDVRDGMKGGGDGVKTTSNCHAKSNIYHPEPKMSYRPRHDESPAEALLSGRGYDDVIGYCPMSGRQSYLPMYRPPDYDSCMSTLQSASDPESLSPPDPDTAPPQYDRAVSQHVYAEITDDDDDDPIYESVNDVI